MSIYILLPKLSKYTDGCDGIICNPSKSAFFLVLAHSLAAAAVTIFSETSSTARS
jgi:hypothetical protein